MTNAELISKAKAEIERRIKILREDEIVRQNCSTDFLEGKIYGYEEVLSFLSTLESEKPTEQNAELNEEIKGFVAEYGYERSEDILLIAIVARHFAQWGMEQASGSSEIPNDLEEAKEAYCEEHNDDCFDATGDKCPHIRNAFIAGAKWQAKRMKDEKEKE